MDIALLNQLIVRAKAATYVGGGIKAVSSRPGSHDLTWSEGDWRYLDSYYGGTDFIGQETVWFAGQPVWAMNYYGYITRGDLIDAARAGETIKAALSDLYRQNRFLGGFEWAGPHGTYSDSSTGDVARFHGREIIMVGAEQAYALDYFGGLIRP